MRMTARVLAIVALPAVAVAQTAPAPTVADDRFQIERDGENFIRLDRKTGAISTCVPAGETLDCRASADERAALQAEIDRLVAEVERLRSQTDSEVPSTGLDEGGKELTLRLPSEAEVKEVVDFFEDMIRRLVEAVKGLADGNP